MAAVPSSSRRKPNRYNYSVNTHRWTRRIYLGNQTRAMSNAQLFNRQKPCVQVQESPLNLDFVTEEKAIDMAHSSVFGCHRHQYLWLDWVHSFLPRHNYVYGQCLNGRWWGARHHKPCLISHPTPPPSQKKPIYKWKNRFSQVYEA